jgi:hypothetical protein
MHALIGGSEQLTLSYEFSLLYVVMLNFSTNVIYVLMILSGGLRFISLYKNSEAAGLQLLGVDNEALIFIRLLSVFISLLIPSTTIPLYDAYPGIFRLLHYEKISSNLDDIKQNSCVAIYLVLPALAVVFNIIVIFYSNWIKREMKKKATALTIQRIAGESLNVEKFSFSISQVTLIPFLILIILIQSFSDRRIRLMFHGPFHVFLVNVLLPIVIIFVNKKIRNYFQKKYSAESFRRLVMCTRRCNKNKVWTIHNVKLYEVPI